MSFESITEIWTYCTQRDVVWEHYRKLNLLHSTICRLRALQKSELITLNEMSFDSTSIKEIWTYCTQRGVVWEHNTNLNLLHSTRCRLSALQKSELIALNEMSFESITEIWTALTRCRLRALQKSAYCTQRVSFESITESWTYCTQRCVVWEHYRNLNLLHSTRCRLRALQKSELIALNDMLFESIKEIWTYCTQRGVVWEHNTNLNLLHSTRCRLSALQKSELIALNEKSFESITEIWTFCTHRYVVWEH